MRHAAVVVTASVPLFAQTSAVARSLPAAGARFTLADATALARAGHPVLQVIAGRRLSISGAARQEGAFPNPVLEWRRENLGSAIPRDEFYSASLPVDVYGRRLALRSASAMVTTRAIADSVTAMRGIEYDVAHAYWEAAYAARVREIATVHRAAIDSIAAIETERARQGAVAVGSALRAQLEADRAFLSEAAARAGAEHARAALARALALPFDSVPMPTDSIGNRDMRPISDIVSLLMQARDRRSELVAARARVDETERRQRAERLGSLPGLGLQSGSKRTGGVLTGVIQLGVTIPLFDRNGGARERAAGDALVAAGELRALQAAVHAEVSAAARAYESLRVGVMAVASRRQSEPSEPGPRGAAVAEIAAAAYREGAIPLFDLLDAYRVRAESNVAMLRAATDLQLAHIDLLRAVGVPVDSNLTSSGAR
jgi:outer membrane protein, heavy metal efflux system